MFKENKDEVYYLGFIKKVFDDMTKKSKLVQISQDAKESFYLFQVKLIDMKYFLEAAK